MDDLNFEVFKTDLQEFKQSLFLKEKILHFFPEINITFDLEDCDNVMRIEGNFELMKIFDIAQETGVRIEPLPE